MDRYVKTTSAIRNSGQTEIGPPVQRDDVKSIGRSKPHAPSKEMLPTSRAPISAKKEKATALQVGFDEAVTALEPLSVRAENVLKILAVELTGETPPQGRWTPSERLLEKLTYKHLSIARNCGPRTTAEIIKWARARGKMIERLPQTGRSLAVMWRDTIEKFSTGEITKDEVATALRNSTRRRNTRIPVALQQILLQLITGG